MFSLINSVKCNCSKTLCCVYRSIRNSAIIFPDETLTDRESALENTYCRKKIAKNMKRIKMEIDEKRVERKYQVQEIDFKDENERDQ